MKRRILVYPLILILAGCAADINLRMAGHESCPEVTADYKSARKAAIKMDCSGITVITGEVAMDGNTVQALANVVKDK